MIKQLTEKIKELLPSLKPEEADIKAKEINAREKHDACLSPRIKRVQKAHISGLSIGRTSLHQRADDYLGKTAANAQECLGNQRPVRGEIRLGRIESPIKPKAEATWARTTQKRILRRSEKKDAPKSTVS